MSGNKTVDLVKMILARYHKEDELEAVLIEAKAKDFVRANLNIKKISKRTQSSKPKKDPSAYNLYCFKEGFGSDGWKTSELNKTSDNFSPEALETAMEEFKEHKAQKAEASPSKSDKPASAYNVYVSVNSGDGVSFPELAAAWKTSELNKASDNFNQAALDEAREKYNAKKNKTPVTSDAESDKSSDSDKED